MSGTTDLVKIAYQCPVCGNALPHVAAVPPFDAPCCGCGAYLWCRQRNSAAGVVLEVVSRRAPEPWEVAEVIDALGRHGRLDRVTLDLSRLEIIHSSFLAALVGTKKRLRAAGCELYLLGLRPMVREIFDRLRLDKLFHIVQTEEDIAVVARRISTTGAISAGKCGYRDGVSPVPVL